MSRHAVGRRTGTHMAKTPEGREQSLDPAPARVFLASLAPESVQCPLALLVGWCSEAGVRVGTELLPLNRGGPPPPPPPSPFAQGLGVGDSYVFFVIGR